MVDRQSKDSYYQQQLAQAAWANFGRAGGYPGYPGASSSAPSMAGHAPSTAAHYENYMQQLQQLASAQSAFGGAANPNASYGTPFAFPPGHPMHFPGISNYTRPLPAHSPLPAHMKNNTSSSPSSLSTQLPAHMRSNPYQQTTNYHNLNSAYAAYGMAGQGGAAASYTQAQEQEKLRQEQEKLRQEQERSLLVQKEQERSRQLQGRAAAAAQSQSAPQSRASSQDPAQRTGLPNGGPSTSEVNSAYTQLQQLQQLQSAYNQATTGMAARESASKDAAKSKHSSASNGGYPYPGYQQPSTANPPTAGSPFSGSNPSMGNNYDEIAATLLNRFGPQFSPQLLMEMTKGYNQMSAYPSSQQRASKQGAGKSGAQSSSRREDSQAKTAQSSRREDTQAKTAEAAAAQFQKSQLEAYRNSSASQEKPAKEQHEILQALLHQHAQQSKEQQSKDAARNQSVPSGFNPNLFKAGSQPSVDTDKTKGAIGGGGAKQESKSKSRLDTPPGIPGHPGQESKSKNRLDTPPGIPGHPGGLPPGAYGAWAGFLNQGMPGSPLASEQGSNATKPVNSSKDSQPLSVKQDIHKPINPSINAALTRPGISTGIPPPRMTSPGPPRISPAGLPSTAMSTTPSMTSPQCPTDLRMTSPAMGSSSKLTSASMGPDPTKMASPTYGSSGPGPPSIPGGQGPRMTSPPYGSGPPMTKPASLPTDPRMGNPQAGYGHQMISPPISGARMTSPGQSDPRMMGPNHSDPRTMAPSQSDPRMMAPSQSDPRMMGPRHSDPRMMSMGYGDPRMMGPRHSDPRMIGPGQMDPRMAAPGQNSMRHMGPGHNDMRMTGPSHSELRMMGPGQNDARMPSSGHTDSRTMGPGDARMTGPVNSELRAAGPGNGDARLTEQEKNYARTMGLDSSDLRMKGMPPPNGTQMTSPQLTGGPSDGKMNSSPVALNLNNIRSPPQDGLTMASPTGQSPYPRHPQMTSPHGQMSPRMTSPHGSVPPQMTSPRSYTSSQDHPQISPRMTSPQGPMPSHMTSPHGQMSPRMTSPQGSIPLQMASPRSYTSSHDQPQISPQMTSPQYSMTSSAHISPQLSSHGQVSPQMPSPHSHKAPQVNSPHDNNLHMSSPSEKIPSLHNSPEKNPHLSGGTPEKLSNMNISPEKIPQITSPAMSSHSHHGHITSSPEQSPPYTTPYPSLATPASYSRPTTPTPPPASISSVMSATRKATDSPRLDTPPGLAGNHRLDTPPGFGVHPPTQPPIPILPPTQPPKDLPPQQSNHLPTQPPPQSSIHPPLYAPTHREPPIPPSNFSDGPSPFYNSEDPGGRHSLPIPTLPSKRGSSIPSPTPPKTSLILPSSRPNSPPNSQPNFPPTSHPLLPPHSLIPPHFSQALAHSVASQLPIPSSGMPFGLAGLASMTNKLKENEFSRASKPPKKSNRDPGPLKGLYKMQQELKGGRPFPNPTTPSYAPPASNAFPSSLPGPPRLPPTPTLPLSENKHPKLNDLPPYATPNRDRMEIKNSGIPGPGAVTWKRKSLEDSPVMQGKAKKGRFENKAMPSYSNAHEDFDDDPYAFDDDHESENYGKNGKGPVYKYKNALLSREPEISPGHVGHPETEYNVGKSQEPDFNVGKYREPEYNVGKSREPEYNVGKSWEPQASPARFPEYSTNRVGPRETDLDASPEYIPGKPRESQLSPVKLRETQFGSERPRESQLSLGLFGESQLSPSPSRESRQSPTRSASPDLSPGRLVLQEPELTPEPVKYTPPAHLPLDCDNSIVNNKPVFSSKESSTSSDDNSRSSLGHISHSKKHKVKRPKHDGWIVAEPSNKSADSEKNRNKKDERKENLGRKGPLWGLPKEAENILPILSKPQKPVEKPPSRDKTNSVSKPEPRAKDGKVSTNDVWLQAFGGVKSNKKPRPVERETPPKKIAKVEREEKTVQSILRIPPEMRRKPRPDFGGLIHFSPDWIRSVRRHHERCRLPLQLDSSAKLSPKILAGQSTPKKNYEDFARKNMVSPPDIHALERERAEVFSRAIEMENEKSEEISGSVALPSVVDAILRNRKKLRDTSKMGRMYKLPFERLDKEKKKILLQARMEEMKRRDGNIGMLPTPGLPLLTEDTKDVLMGSNFGNFRRQTLLRYFDRLGEAGDLKAQLLDWHPEVLESKTRRQTSLTKAVTSVKEIFGFELPGKGSGGSLKTNTSSAKASVMSNNGPKASAASNSSAKASVTNSVGKEKRDSPVEEIAPRVEEKPVRKERSKRAPKSQPIQPVDEGEEVSCYSQEIGEPTDQDNLLQAELGNFALDLLDDNPSWTKRVTIQNLVIFETIEPALVKKKKGGKKKRSRKSGLDFNSRSKKSKSSRDVSRAGSPTPPEDVHDIEYSLSNVILESNRWVVDKNAGETILHRAAKMGYPDVVAYAVDMLGVSVMEKDYAGLTPLHKASYKGHDPIVKVLLKYGADPGAGVKGTRALHEAIEGISRDCVCTLLTYGADPLLHDYSGNMPIDLADNDPDMKHYLYNILADLAGVPPKVRGVLPENAKPASRWNVSHRPDFHHPPESLEASGTSSSVSGGPSSKFSDDNDNLLFEVTSHATPNYFQFRDKEGVFVLYRDLKEYVRKYCAKTDIRAKGELLELGKTEFFKQSHCAMLDRRNLTIKTEKDEKDSSKEETVLLVKVDKFVKKLLNMETIPVPM